MGFDGMTLIVKSSLRETVDRHEISALAMTRVECQTNRCSNFKSIIKSRHCICS